MRTSQLRQLITISQMKITLGHCQIFTRYLLLLVCVYLPQLALQPIILALIFLHLKEPIFIPPVLVQLLFQISNGANGYTLKIENENTIFSYSHISPNFIIEIGDFVNKGQIIAYVGPKYLEDNPQNPYFDYSEERPTNGATTGPHLHFSTKIDGTAIDPVTLFRSYQT